MVSQNIPGIIDLRTEKLLSFPQAARFVSSKLQDRRGGKACHVSTIHRWASRGLRAVKLEFTQIGGTRATSVQALGRFFDRLAGNEPNTRSPSPSPQADSGRNRRLVAAERELREAGI